MCAYVVGVVRSAMRLEALTFETRDAADCAFPWKVESSCELRTLPHNSHEELWTAWRALESVTSWDETTLGHVLTVLRGTPESSDEYEIASILSLEWWDDSAWNEVAP